MIDETIIITYLLITLMIGLYKARGTKTMRTYSIAYRNYTTPIIVATMFATFVGGGITLGGAQESFNVGITYILVSLALPIGYIIAAQFIIPKMSQFSGMISVGEIMERFYGKPGRVLTGIGAFLQSAAVVGGQVAALGYFLHYFLQMPPHWGVIIGAGIVVLYSTFGGIKGVTATDIVQFGVLIVATPIVFNVGLKNIGGLHALFSALPDNHLKIFPTEDSLYRYLPFFFISMFCFIEPATIQRFLMSKDTRQAVCAFRSTGMIGIVFFVISGLIGLIAFVLEPNIESNLALPFLIKSTLPIGIKGLAISGILAVIMSSADSFLNAGSIALVHDVIKPLSSRKISDTVELRLARLTTFLVGTFAIIVALKFENLLSIVKFSFLFWLPVITVPFLAAMFNLTISKRGFLTCALIGPATNFFWDIMIQPVVGFDGFIPGILMNALTFTIFYFIKKSKRAPEPKKARKAVPRYYNFSLNNLFLKFKPYSPTLANILRFSASRIARSYPQYSLFGIFIVVNYLLPYFMWSYNAEHFNIHLTFRIIAGVLCIALIAKDHWPQRLQKFLPLYWHITLLFTLPFLTTYMLLDSQGSLISLMSVTLASLFLAILIDWLSFVIILPLGASLAWGFCWLTHGIPPISINSDIFYAALYTYIFAVAIGLFFSRSKERQEYEKLLTLQAMGANIAHEMRTPLAALNMGASQLAQLSSLLGKVYSSAKEKNISVEGLDPFTIKNISEVPKIQQETSRNALNIIDMLLNNIKGQTTFNQKLETCSMVDCVEKALARYPFNDFKEKSKVSWKPTCDFEFQGNRELMIYVFFNLFKNALYYIKHAHKGEISIWIEQKEERNFLHFKDTALGIPSYQLKNIFKKFYSKRKNGTGLGLVFCQDVIQSFGGIIICESIEGEFTEFIISFPQT